MNEEGGILKVPCLHTAFQHYTMNTLCQEREPKASDFWICTK